MLKKAFTHTPVYKYIWAPAANFTRVAFNQTVAYLNNIGLKTDPVDNEKLALIDDIPQDILQILTENQKLQLMHSRHIEHKSKKSGEKKYSLKPIRKGAKRRYKPPSLLKSKAKTEKSPIVAKKKTVLKKDITASESDDSD